MASMKFDMFRNMSLDWTKRGIGELIKEKVVFASAGKVCLRLNCLCLGCEQGWQKW